MTRVRNATAVDLPAIMEVEADWPAEQRAPVEKFRARLERFPQGGFVALVEEQIVGVCTSCLTRYDAEHLETFASWERVTNDGYLHPLAEIDRPNALYIVSNGIKKAHRGTGVRELLLGAQLDLTRRLGLPYALTGAMLPGYDAYCQANGEVAAARYVFLRQGGKPVDPTVRKLGEVGFHPPDARHVIAGYYSSPESRDYAVLLLYRNPAVPSTEWRP